MDNIPSISHRQTKTNMLNKPYQNQKSSSLLKENAVNGNTFYSQLGQIINQSHSSLIPLKILQQSNAPPLYPSDSTNSLTRQDFKITSTSTNQRFLPFVHERDGIGRLIPAAQTEKELRECSKKQNTLRTLNRQNLAMLENDTSITSQSLLNIGAKRESSLIGKESCPCLNSIFSQYLPNFPNQVPERSTTPISFQRYFALKLDKVNKYYASDQTSKKEENTSFKKPIKNDNNSLEGKHRSIKIQNSERAQSERRIKNEQQIQISKILEMRNCLNSKDQRMNYHHVKQKQPFQIPLNKDRSKQKPQSIQNEKFVVEDDMVEYLPNFNWKNNKSLQHQSKNNNLNNQKNSLEITSQPKLNNSFKTTKVSQKISPPQMRSQDSQEYKQTFADFFKGVKVTQSDIDKVIRTDLFYFNVNNNQEEKISKFQEENIAKFTSGISTLKKRAKALQKNIVQMSEKAMSNIRLENTPQGIKNNAANF